MKSRLELLSHRIKEKKDDFDLKIKDMQEVLKNYKSAEENKTVMAGEFLCPIFQFSVVILY